MTQRTTYTLIFVAALLIFLALLPFAREKSDLPFKNVILIGWDGVQKNHFDEMLAEKKLPYFQKYFLDGGTCVDTFITTGTTQTKPGWSEILTGYGPAKTGVFSNLEYAPIPQGYTLFERLEEYFGNDNIFTIFISGKKNNMAATGPHKVCTNCLKRDPLTNASFRRRDVDSYESFLQKRPDQLIFEDRKGEPYFITKNYIDVYHNEIGESGNVLRSALSHIRALNKEKRFFMFLHYEEPDRQGHDYGENSLEYDSAMIEIDKRLEGLAEGLREMGVWDNTLLYITTDHGMNEGANEHTNAPETFFCSIDKENLRENGDRKDIAPTILGRYGIDVEKLTPSFDGTSLTR